MSPRLPENGAIVLTISLGNAAAGAALAVLASLPFGPWGGLGAFFLLLGLSAVNWSRLEAGGSP